MRRFLLIFGVSATLFALGAWRLSDGFTLSKMTAPLSYSAKWEVDAPPALDTRAILAQPFYYMGKGSQSFVFESLDRQYVLKFFRLNRYRLPAFQEKLPLPPFLSAIQQQRIDEKWRKREKLFESCTLAYNQLKQESGLVYVHLNKTTNLTLQVEIYDNLRRKHVIAIDEYAFMLQKRGEQVYPYLSRLLKEGKKEEARRALMSLSSLLSERMAKNIADGDAEIHKNAGFRNGEALFLDVGQFRREHSVENKERLARKLLAWLEEKDPEFAVEARAIFSVSTQN